MYHCYFLIHYIGPPKVFFLSFGPLFKKFAHHWVKRCVFGGSKCNVPEICTFTYGAALGSVLCRWLSHIALIRCVVTTNLVSCVACLCGELPWLSTYRLKTSSFDGTERCEGDVTFLEIGVIIREQCIWCELYLHTVLCCCFVWHLLYVQLR